MTITVLKRPYSKEGKYDEPEETNGSIKTQRSIVDSIAFMVRTAPIARMLLSTICERSDYRAARYFDLPPIFCLKFEFLNFEFFC